VEIAAFVPLSLSDHEGHVAGVVFVSGCNYRCPFCHNPELVLPGLRMPLLEPSDVLRRLGERRGFLDSVVVTGGEPTLQPDLAGFLSELRGIGLLVKLDTNGSRPESLAELLERGLVDTVAMDVKAPLHRYRDYAGTAADIAAIETSMQLLRARAPDYEFRTTVAPGLGGEDLVAIARWIAGARRFFLQPFRSPSEKGLVDPAWETKIALSPDALREIWNEIAPIVRGGGVRA